MRLRQHLLKWKQKPAEVAIHLHNILTVVLWLIAKFTNTPQEPNTTKSPIHLKIIIISYLD